MITFTGSTRTGKQLLKDAGDSNMKRVWLRPAVKVPHRICRLPGSAEKPPLMQRQVFYNQGQVCIAGTRLLLEESIADEFIAL